MVMFARDFENSLLLKQTLTKTLLIISIVPSLMFVLSVIGSFLIRCKLSVMQLHIQINRFKKLFRLFLCIKLEQLMRYQYMIYEPGGSQVMMAY